MNQMRDHSFIIRSIAQTLGFDFCGISKAQRLDEEAPRLAQWLKDGKQGNMQYMENHFEKRLDPQKLVHGTKSVVTLLYNYSPREKLPMDQFKLAKYAYGDDYHHIIKKKLHQFMGEIQEQIGEVGGRVFVDSAPILERVWAKKAGLGWIGKNTLLINKQKGSFFFIAVLLLDLELEADGPVKDYCGTCTRCIDACPTNALTPYQLDASKCISYLTIELKEEIPTEFKGKMENWVFGCDICQDVCPWNRFAEPHAEPLFEPHEALKNWRKNEWKEITQEVFNKVFKKSAVKRTKFKGLRRNIDFLSD